MIKRTHFDSMESRWAGVGPYFAMFPTAFCDAVVEKFTKPGEVVLDPFAGRGTALFSAACAGRCGLGIELNPVGWIYSRTKLSPADRDAVERRIKYVQAVSPRYRGTAASLPIFFRHCFSKPVREFLVAARHELNWRGSEIDRTTMAFLLIHLHGKKSDSLSNQMRQTKAMAPNYAIAWWQRNSLRPPRRDPFEFFKKKLDWRYAKGTPKYDTSKVYLGDSTDVLRELRGTLASRGLRRPTLLLTSPPYLGITNYHYDQWLRLWLLGGPPTDRRTETKFNGKHRGKFGNVSVYRRLLNVVFQRAASIVSPRATVYVRTDRREPTLHLTREAMLRAFPHHDLRRITRKFEGESQTRLFGHYDPRFGEVDLILTYGGS
jgi:hypothetical protein